MKKYEFRALLNQFLSYFIVGGLAAITEWVSFYLFNHAAHFNIFLSTTVSFLIATFVNWILGKKITFRDCAAKKPNGEVFQIYIVSAIGLGFNLLLMYLFVNILHIYSLPAKILATGVVFFWNFISRKVFIYR